MMAPNKTGVLLAGILLLGAALRVPLLTRSLWFDEVWYSTLTGFRAADGGLWKHVLYDKAAPFHQVLMYFWVRAFGDSEISVRAIPFLCGILAIFYTYLIALRLTDRPAAVLTAALMSLSAAHIWYSREAVPYSFLVFISLVSVHAFYKLKEGGAFFFWYPVYFISLVVAIFTHWWAFVFLLIFTGLLFFEKRSSVKWAIGMGNLLIAGLLLGFLVFKLQSTGKLQTGDSFLRAFSPVELWMLLFNYFSFGNSLWPLFPYRQGVRNLAENLPLLFSQILFAFFFIRGLLIPSANPNRRDLWWYLFLLPLLLMAASLAGYRNLYIERYALILLPFFYAAVANGAAGFKKKLSRSLAAVILVLYSMVSLAGSFAAVAAERWSVYKPNSDWRSLAEYLLQVQKTEGAPVVVLAVSPAVSLIHYRDRLKKEINESLDLSGHGRVDGKFYDFLNSVGKDQFYLVRDIYWDTGFRSALEKLSASPSVRRVSEVSFEGLRAYRYQIEASGVSGAEGDAP